MSISLNALIILLHRLGESVPAVLITAALAILVASALGCACTPCRAKDRLFKREVY